MVALVIWALVWPSNANSNLGSLNWSLLENFNAFYIILVGLFVLFLAVVAVLPQMGQRKMGRADEAPEFFQFFMVFRDVWSGPRGRADGFCHGRAIGALGLKP